ncbi:hypothetical protein D3P06_00880 [Paracoccus aestuarii]|uniref:Uncharacterized protein n=1 Tax=Paracoccus aestuarii TaxID=453842 RepID=A0A419A2D2_9RHOB|nr:hypothetical protein [Paracoccus aestuarii]RJL07326.1 hypothetical protein D3P06_00880 [Paracoccus aestuarii]WCR00052.1 hypothetical protein JHW48_04910 [Paracoccus aestuarii]
MFLILLAISLAFAACVIAFNFAIYALPFMVGLTAFQYVWASEAGFFMSALAALGAAILSVGFVIAVLGFAKNPYFRLFALALFAIPATIAGYALVYGITKNAIDSTIALNILGGIGGVAIGGAAMAHLSALGQSVLSR